MRAVIEQLYLQSGESLGGRGAAGNDTGKTGVPAPTGPRFPAAADSVLGVGALKDTSGGAFIATD